ncbi:hypothetical protein BOTNAR_0203g00190 [Botryotinia narcissicola]|uniref:ABC transporter domain-containing protein n=1 Tax=Botryotinia narcissicola TaxID=278944 RepID=A0A4Z1IKV6_9HELO|nr:hypothetical protein BOTNAR_0203g00190 [Botryotinia narcissicola]
MATISHDTSKHRAQVIDRSWPAFLDTSRWSVDILQLVGIAAAIGAGTARPLMPLIFGGLANKFNNFQDASALKETVDSEVLYLLYLFIAIHQDTGLVSQGKVADNFTTSINSIEDALAEKLGVVMQAGSTVIVSLIIAFVHSWQLTLVLFSTIVLLFISNFGTAALDTHFEQKIQQIEESAANLAEEVLNGIRMVMACVAESKLVDDYTAILEAARTKRMQKSPILAVQFSMSYFALLSSYALAFWYGTILLNQGKISSGGTIIIAILSINQGTNGMRKILPIYGILSKARAASVNLNTVINSTTTVNSLKSGDLVLESIKGEIELHDISYFYPSRPSVNVLDHLNIRFEAGKMTALVGTSGSGKSTIVGLIERWYEPTQGSVSIDGFAINELDVKSLRSKIGLVQQEVTLFNDSIFYNVACGLYGTSLENYSDKDKRDLVVKSCINVGAHDFIESLPEGYNTKVGDKGNLLSGGQKQRISIARAIISSPQILIFDEATSGLDIESERIVEAAIKKVSIGMTSIVITHKLSLVQKADQIVLLKNGTVHESGTHQSLLAMNGKYAQLDEAQRLDETIQYTDQPLGKSEIQEDDKIDATKLQLDEMAQPKKTFDDMPTPLTPDPPRSSLFQSLWTSLVEHRVLMRLFAAVVPTCVIAGGVYPTQTILFGHSVSRLGKFDSNIQKTENFWSLMWFVVAIGVIIAFFLMGTISSIIGTTTKFYYQTEYFKSMIRQDPLFFDKEQNSKGTLVASLSLHTSHIQILFTVLGSLLVALVNLTSCSIFALVVSWRLALVGLFGSVPVILLAGYLRVRSASAKSKTLSGPLLNSAQYASEVIGAVRTVAALTMEDEVCLQLDKRMRESLPVFYKNILVTMPLFAFSESGAFLGMALIFWYGGNLLANGKLETVELWIVFLAILSGGEGAAEFFASSSSISQAGHSINKILELRSRAASMPDGTTSQQHNYDDEKIKNSPVSIEFHGVEFSYPNSSQHLVLKEIDFMIEPGQNLAIVGPSGSGKSTIIALLEKFYTINNGSILIDTSSLNDIDTQHHRSQTGLVSQNTVLFEGTLRDNILLGVRDLSSIDERLENAAKDANIHDFIISLPEGYNTQCGEKGFGFSGGQRQRIALARALVRQPKILLLDEATSALDSLSEKEVLDALNRISGQTTTITVAHRLATIRKADCILVLVKGRIVERGTHLELMELRGTYWAMNQAQALDKDF